MRKSWNVAMRLGRVDAVIMVGDMMDWGRGVFGEEEYENYLARFKSIFRVPEEVTMKFVAGNHDVVGRPLAAGSETGRFGLSRWTTNGSALVVL